ncbi:TolC family protein [Magnetospirillum molischianum]|uniref:Putative Outer membrane efflux protein n=1 Tax=Magnetospirillum molischianum DSM 120 TaxID=1150626 RepID=H8FP00_MAGML|nr:TolC family protein [Magnetospirillum molischianum]CCG40088.1 putative Outer membrane efflux protein [Magnetospirillum molischianum DSM 120]
MTMKARRTVVTMALLAAFASCPPAWAEEAGSGPELTSMSSSGGSVDSLLNRARQMSLELQVAALEAEAATARIEGAGSLADPKLSLSVEDWNTNRNGGFFPGNPAASTMKKLRLSQELPFWGKRDLKREIAAAGARKAAVLKRQVENDLIARVKFAYADYHSAHLVIEAAKDLRTRLDTLARLARVRYAQALGRLQDVTRAEVEKSSLDAEIVRVEGERRKARARINRLLARPLDTPLLETPIARPIPVLESLDLAVLSERAQSENPDILAQIATIEGSDKALSLAERSWYPDFEVGVSAVKREGDWRGYEAMVSMNLPLQWGLRESDIGEAKAMTAAARAKREVRSRELDNEVADAWISLKSAHEVEMLLRESQLPQAEIGFQAALRSYEFGRSEMVDVFQSEQQVWKSHIDLVKVVFEQQVRLAELEKLVGRDL